MAVTLTPVNRGTVPGDKTGDEPYDAFGKVNTSDSALKAGVDLVLDLPQSTILGRVTAGTGDPEKLTTAQVKTLLDLTGTNSGDQTSIVGITGTIAQFNTALTDGSFATGGGTATGTNTGDQTITLTGDVTGSGTGSFAATIANSAVTLAKMADVATGTVFYRKTAATGVPEVQTLATLKTDLGLTGTNSGDQTSIVGITGSLAEFNTALTGADFATGGGTATGTNTGDQTSLTGISDTKANFNTALSDGSFFFSGDTLAWSSVTATPTTLSGYGISDTQANFNTALSDGSFAFSGGAFHDGFSDYVANEHIDWTNTTSNVVTTGAVTAGNVVIGNPTLTVDNQFYLSALTATIPALTFDVTDSFAYNRTTNAFTWSIGGATEATLSATTLDLQSNAITTTGAITGGTVTATGAATASSFVTAHGTHPVSNLQYQGQVEQWEAGATVTAGLLVMLQTDLTQNEVVHATDATNAPIVGVALTGGAAGATIDVLVRGTVRLTGAHFTSTSGTFCYASPTAGNITPTVTTTTGDFVKIAGYCIDTDVMFVNPQWNFVEVA